MVTEEVRPIREGEKAELLARLVVRPPVKARRIIKTVAICAVGIVGCFLAIVCLFAFVPNPGIGGTIIGIPCVAGIIFLYIPIAVIESYFSERKWIRYCQTHIFPVIEATLRDGKVFSRKITATSVIEIVPSHDIVFGYIFDIGNGKSLFLRGERFYPVNENMPWPCSEFEIVENPDRKLWVGIFCYGTTLEPTQSVDSEDCKDDFAYAATNKDEIVPKSPQEFIADILKPKK